MKPSHDYEPYPQSDKGERDYLDRKIQKPNAVTWKTCTFVKDGPFNLLSMQEAKDINRLKIVLAELKRTDKCLDMNVRTLIIQIKRGKLEIETDKLL